MSVPELATPLFDTTFVVLDLETTGLSPDADRITEVGAVKVRGGEVLGELRSLVHPGRPVPSAVTAVTGIADAMLVDAPPIATLLPSLLSFLDGAVLVAHNARFDVAFLRAAITRHRGEAFDPVVVDTARLARRLLRDEVRDTRLATLARHLRSRIVPDHRALTDARATVDVLHGLIERAGSYGATTLEDLRDLARSTSEPSYRRVGLVRDAPRAAGVYRFLDERGTVLYVGKATDLHARLRTYFGQDPRRRVHDLVRETSEVTWDTTSTLLEAEIREVRAIHAHRPRYNRRSRQPERTVHVAVTDERFPRLSLVRTPGRGHARTFGPLPSRHAGETLVEALQAAVPVRVCTPRLRRAQDHPPCVLKDLGRCGAPCDGTQSVDDYAAVTTRLHAALDDPAIVLQALDERMQRLAAGGRYERAAEVRRRLHAVARVLRDHRRTAALAASGRVAVARRDGPDVEVVVLDHGRLVTSVRDRVGGDLVRTAVALAAPGLVAPASAPDGHDLEERRLVAAWLDRPGVHLVAGDGALAEPVAGGARLAACHAEAARTDRRVRRDRRVLSGAKVAARTPAA